MKHSIGKTIAKLRKERKWTQLELAEKLGVSDKAVSKWESEGGFPEITQFPILSKLFDVTIDYLMTGKTADTITLDDMDEQKRMEYLIRRDDAENYTKYGYLSKTSVFDISPDNAPLKAILTHKSKNIFQACAEKAIPVDATNRYRFKFYQQPELFNEVIQFACLMGSVTYLEKIGFLTFAVGGTHTPFEGGRSCKANPLTCDKSSAFHISPETVKTVISSKETPSRIIDYVSTYVPFNANKVRYFDLTTTGYRMNGTFYFLEQEIIKQLYLTGEHERLEHYLQSALADSLQTAELYTSTQSADACYTMSSGAYLLQFDKKKINPEASKIVLGKVVAISKETIGLAIAKLDEAYANRFIHFNKEISAALQYSGFSPFMPTEQELEDLFKKAKRAKRIEKIKSNSELSPHDRRMALAQESVITAMEAVFADDYDAFAMLSEQERNTVTISDLLEHNARDLRFYIYAVNINQDVNQLHSALKTILEAEPQRYDIQDLLLSAGAILDGNVAMTNVLKQNLMVLAGKSLTDSHVEISDSVTKKELIEKIKAHQLQYVIVNVTIQLEKRLKAHLNAEADLADLIDQVFAKELIDTYTCTLLHHLRIARNGIIHGTDKGYYTPEIVRMWVNAVYSF